MTPKMTINENQRLYVMDCGAGYTCLGFDVLDRRARALALELDRHWCHEIGTVEAYEAYHRLLDVADEKNKRTGWRSSSELTPQLVGLEGKRVEVLDAHGEKRRFIVGRSTGITPCHLEIKTRVSSGGMAVMGTPFKSVRVVKS